MKLPKIDKTIPNVISVMRIPLGAVAMVTAANYEWVALAAALVGLLTKVFDGYIAVKYNMMSESGKMRVLPTCDLLFGVFVVVGLVIAGVWPLWVALTIAFVAIVFQLIDAFANRSDLMRKLKRHQHYLHPALSVGTMVMAGSGYIKLVALDDPALQFLVACGYIGVAYMVIIRRNEYLKKLLAGPERAPSNNS